MNRGALVLFAFAWAPSALAQAPAGAPKYQAVVELGAESGEGSTAPLAAAAIETGRADVGGAFHLAVGIDMRREPRLTMVKAAGLPVESAYVSGWATSVSLRIAHAYASSEASVVGRIGSARLDSVSNAAANGIGPWTAFYDARGELRWYGRDMSEVYRSADALMPVVQAYGGIRHDQRFHRAGDLSGFNDPTARWFLGAVVMPFRWARFSFGGGFDFETAVRTTDRLPAGLKFAIRADLNLRKAAGTRD